MGGVRMEELEEQKMKQLKIILVEILQELSPQSNFPDNPDDFKGDQSVIWYFFIKGLPENIIKKHTKENGKINKEEMKSDLIQCLKRSQESLNVFERMEKTLEDSVAHNQVSEKWDKSVISFGKNDLMDAISSILGYADAGEKPNRNIVESLLFGIGNSFLFQLEQHGSLKLGNLGLIVIEGDQPVFKPSEDLTILLDVSKSSG